jgi:cytosine/adenosine deaminase-related metal-dependent hydrolase
MPISSPPIERGVVCYSGDRIVDVGDHTLCNSDTVDFGDAVIMPGLINAHTHLELSHLAGRVRPTGDFVLWIRNLIEATSSDAEPHHTAAASARAGAAACINAGVTRIGDITRHCTATRTALRDGPLGVLSYGEVLGFGRSREHIDDRLAVAADDSTDSLSMRTGLSPHAPYSIEPAGARRVADRAASNQTHTCVHLAESPAEIEFLASGQGPFRDLLQSLDLDDGNIPVPGCSPISWAHNAGLLGPRCLVAHANYVTDEDIDLLCQTGSSVAYCPRTHLAFKHPRHPWLNLIGAGVNVCIATDSLASSPSLSVLDELAVVARDPEGPSLDTLIEMVTINPARALGAAAEAGSLDAGKAADLAVFACPDEVEEALFGSPVLLATYIGGHKVT